jgi:hypothetical protein
MLHVQTHLTSLSVTVSVASRGMDLNVRKHVTRNVNMGSVLDTLNTNVSVNWDGQE